ncbi:glycosyltransferase [Thioalkalivibrio sulfidiphilus]|uniref:glycosyltransferase n=1 Tax=Thioalkalivibrio sulfidiphilus TaxID=1033854 RepID=UPI003B391A0D
MPNQKVFFRVSLEAMASGVPVLTGNRASLPEVVGDAGIMINPYDVDAIADSLIRLIEDSTLRSRLRVKGLERVQLFSWDITAERTLAILNQVSQK